MVGVSLERFASCRAIFANQCVDSHHDSISVEAGLGYIERVEDPTAKYATQTVLVAATTGLASRYIKTFQLEFGPENLPCVCCVCVCVFTVCFEVFNVDQKTYNLASAPQQMC